MTDEPYRSKQWNYCNDQNQGNYASNQVVFDLSSFYNQNKFIAPSEMFLVVPVVSVLSTEQAAGLQGKYNDFSLGYKSGYYNIISSMQIDYNNKTVQQLTPNLNYYVSFKMNSSMSKSSVDTIGSAIGVYPDTPTSWSYTDGSMDLARVSIGGNGVRNSNIRVANVDTDQDYYNLQDSGNAGAFKRRLNSSFRVCTQNGASRINSTQQPNAEFMNNTVRNNAYQAYYTTMIIRLSDVSDFFASMPLTKGFYARLTLNLNLGSLVVNRSGGGNGEEHNRIFVSASNINFPNGTCPLMLQPSLSNQYANAVTQIVCGIYVGKASSSLGTVNQNSLDIPAHPLNSCRIYAPSIDLQPARALSYIQENRSKYIEWDDVYATRVTVPATQTFNYNITNSLAGIHSIVIIPFIASTDHGLVDGQVVSPFSPAISPFTTEPATTSPLLSISQFNVQLAGENVLSNLLNYTFEEFLEQLAPAHSINGGHSLGLSSGLIDLVGFQNIYRYYYVDLSRRAKDDVGAKGITIMGKNDNLVGMDLFCFVVHKKSASLDVETGILEMRV